MQDRSNVATTLINDEFLIWDYWAVVKLGNNELPPTTDLRAVECAAAASDQVMSLCFSSVQSFALNFGDNS